MRSETKLAHNAETSEKSIEKYLAKRVREAGGLALKYASGTQTGYPDRVCLFPGGLTIWVEVKGVDGRLTTPSPLNCKTWLTSCVKSETFFVCQT